MSTSILLTPPVAFVIVLLAVMGLMFLLSRLSLRRSGAAGQSGGARKPYACGEDIPTHMIQPDYAQFLPFAFFFTILHVMALTIATVPVKSVATLALPVLYVVGGIVGLAVLYRK